MGKILEVKLDYRTGKRLEKYRRSFRFFFHPHRGVWFATERALEMARKKHLSCEVVAEHNAASSGIKITQTFPASLASTPPEAAEDEIIACSMAGEYEGVIPSPIYLGRNIELSRYPGAFILDMAGGSRKYTWRFPQIQERLDAISVAGRFPRLLSVLQDPDTKFVLSLSGGGLKVYAHSVVFRLFDNLGAKDCIDEIWGTSAGAIGGLWYASDVPVSQMEESGYDLYNRRYELKLTPSKFNVFKKLLMEHILPTSMRPSGFKGFLDSAQSIYDYIFRIKQYRQPRIPFFCIAFNINEFRPEILTPLRFDIPEYREKIFTVDPIDAAVASSSVPVLFVPKVIQRGEKEITYIDGMTTESVPMISIYNKWLIDRKIGLEKRSKLFILAVKFCQNTIYELRPDKHISELQMMLIYHDAILNAMVESQRMLITRDKNVEMVEIVTPLSEWNNFDVMGIPTFIRRSYIHYINDLLAFEDVSPIEWSISGL